MSTDELASLLLSVATSSTGPVVSSSADAAVLKDGILQQVDAPRTLYNRPKNRFVAGFIGSPAMNIVDSERVDGALRLGPIEVPLSPSVAAAVAAQPTADFGVGVRPEHLSLGDEGLAGEVVVVEALGSESFIHVRTQHQDTEQLLVVRVDGQSDIDRGDQVTISINGPIHVFGADGERIGD